MTSTEEKVQKSKFKIIIVGETTVGKTSLITKYTTNSYDNESLATTGASYSTKTLFIPSINQTIRLEIWDTAGQERYRALSRLFFKDADAVILLYDITNKDSFEALKSYWLDSIDKEIKLDRIALGIAAHKADMFIDEEVSEEEGKELADKYNAVFKPTSAKDATGIEELFMMVSEKLCGLNIKKRSNTMAIDKKRHSFEKKIEKEKKCC